MSARIPSSGRARAEADNATGPAEAPMSQDAPSKPDLPDHWLAMVERARANWERTGNPLFVWDVVLCAVRQPRIDELQRKDMPEAERIRRADAAPPYPLPTWAWQYLAVSAHRLAILAGGSNGGRDWRKHPDLSQAWDFSNPEAAAIWDEWHKSRITPDEAVKLLSKTFGFTRHGWNAFQRWFASESDQNVYREVAAEVHQGRDLTAARELVMKRWGWNDLDALRKKERAGRAVWGAPPIQARTSKRRGKPPRQD